MRALRESGSELGVSDIVRIVTLPSSTVHRILRTLVGAGYVVQNDQTERYRLGREAFLLGRAASHTLGFDAAMPLLERLAAETEESVNLVVRDGDEALVVLRVESPQPLRFTQSAGDRIPLYCTSTGKVLLAFADDLNAEVAGLGELARLTPRTITSPRQLLEDLRLIRERHFSVNDGERIPGVCGVAAPVIGTDGRVIAALAVQGPAFRMPDERIVELSSLIVRTAEEIGSILPSGYQI